VHPASLSSWRPAQRCGGLVIVVLQLACASPRPQSMERETSSRNATYVSAAEVRAIASRADTAIASDSVARLVSVDGRYNVGVAVVRRQRVGDATPPDALSHHHVTEVYQIIDGSGVFVSGGRIVAGTEMRPDSRGVRRIVGPSERGTGIAGGTNIEVGPGDIIVVPPNTPHGFSRLISPQIVYTVVRVDPDRRLATSDAPR
jgi:mannose-6-phosphate isomerase-like protein (cupin superfamily)